MLCTIRSAALLAALALASPSFGQDAAPGGPAAAAAPREAGSVSAPEAKPYEQVVRLWKAGLSEEFLRRKIERENVVYGLSTDDIIACKAAGVPEPVIEAMMKTEASKVPAGPAAAPPVPAATPVAAAAVPDAPAPPAAPAAPVAPAVVTPPVIAPTVAISQAASAPAPPSLASRADRSWDGIVMRGGGVVLFRNPWQQGVLSFREEKLFWRDAGDESRNLVLPATAIREHFLVCPKDASSDEACFEWGVKTADGEQRFRDVAWAKSDSPKPRELFAFFAALYPDLPTAKYQVAKKK